MENDDLPIAKFVRLQNGDDIICEMLELEDGDNLLYMIVNPLKIIYMPTSSGSLQVAFMPWVFPKICDHQEFTLNPEDVLLVSNTSEKMNNYYWENLDQYVNMYEEGKIVDEEEIEETVDETEQAESVKEVLEQLAKSRRTYH